MNVSDSVDKSHPIGVDESYRPLPSIYLVFSFIWLLSACSWTVNIYKNRHFQTNNLQWSLASLPLLKALQLTLSFLFWYSCFYIETCSLWMSFGVYVTGVLFQTASVVSFLLISHGYCIMSEHLSVSERRTTASIGCIFYLTLVGYRASIPYLSVLLLLNYFISFYVIFHHIYQNLLALQEQLSFIMEEDVQAMHDAILTKYKMFKKFRGIMQIVVMAEIMIFLNMDDSVEIYWLRLLVREWALFCIFCYIGWIFRSQDLASRFSVMQTFKSEENRIIPPIYSVDVDASTFREFNSHNWQIGVPTSLSQMESSKESIFVIIQHPRVCNVNKKSTPNPADSKSSPTDEARHS
ncbi:uncharacterized protein LOC111464293 [Cucurbita moschata]|uniref:Uncharacterized protein LOC111464293 n=1 Tax=Cucurbita moschata TaxID=3662 RepID=A0A6J1HK69_CUCMO|nr:uncharacterized protein LOC111464293 [Cucurbita moschata]